MLGSNVAIPMVLDAQGLFPNWPYQYYTLIGFLAFVIFVGWIIFSKQTLKLVQEELGSPPPERR